MTATKEAKKQGSRWTWQGVLARAAITLAAGGLFLLIRQDYIPVARSKYQTLISPLTVRNYLSSTGEKKLQLGAGPVNLKGWLNTDIEPIEEQAYVDVTKPFPLPDGSIDRIYSEHLLEHIPYADGMKMLRECRRVLKPGGRMRISTPDLEALLSLFGKDDEVTARYVASKHEVFGWPQTVEPKTYLLNAVMHEWGHQFLYTRGLLKGSLESAGFRNVRYCKVGESEDRAFVGIEARASYGKEFAELNDFESLIVEAER